MSRPYLLTARLTETAIMIRDLSDLVPDLVEPVFLETKESNKPLAEPALLSAHKRRDRQR